MKITYKIPVIWGCWGIIEVEAHDIDEALELANEAPLPSGEYIDDSFEIDTEGIRTHNELSQEDAEALL